MNYSGLYEVTQLVEAHYEVLREAGRVTWSLDWEISNSGLSAYATVYVPDTDDPDDYSESYRLRISDHSGRGPIDISIRIEDSDGVNEVAAKAIAGIEEVV